METAFVAFLPVFFSLSSSIPYNTSMTLMTEMLSGYDARLRPVLDQTDPVSVDLLFYFIRITDFDVVAGKFSVYGFLFLTWTDETITWKPDKYDGAQSVVFKLTDVWYPKVILSNSHSKLNDIGDDWMTVRIYSSGYTVFTPGAVFDTACIVDIRYYPFDEQKCYLEFAVWGYTGTEVSLAVLGDGAVTDTLTQNGEWMFGETSVDKLSGNNYTSDMIKFHILLKRKPGYVIVNVFLPICLIAILDLLVFLLPAESGERVSFSVTVLLALAVFMTLVADNLPKTSEGMPILSYFLMLLIVKSALISVTTILNLRLYFKTGTVPTCVKNCVQNLHCYLCRFKKKSNIKTNTVQPGTDGDIKDITNGDIKDITDGDIKDITDNCSDISVTNKHEISWKDVSVVMDFICGLVFFLITVIISLIFLVFLSRA